MLQKISVKDIALNNNITFSTYSAIDGKLLFNATVVGRVSYNGLPGGNNAATYHLNTYQLLPPAQQQLYDDDYETYNYLIVKDFEDDKIHYIGEAWIDPASTWISVPVQLKITINDFTDPDTVAIRSLLLENGYDITEVSLTSP